MKVLVAALAVTAILPTSAVARIHTTLCHYAQTDPDPRIRSALRRDCNYYEYD
jgi:hypothetical protein